MAPSMSLCQRLASIFPFLFPAPPKRPSAVKPLANGTLAPPTPSSLRQLKAELDRNLEQHVLRNWLPRSVDSKIGGFQQDYDISWRPGSINERGAVYQSRNTWLAAHAALDKSGISPEEKARMIEYSNHGVDYLLNHQWDSENGGFYWKISGDGTPANDGEKHLYGISFAIYALAENFKASGDARALDLAKDAFWWLEKHAHDSKHRGYFEAFSRDGSPILAASGSSKFDSIGTQYGFKSMNSHIHLLESFTVLYEVWNEEKLLHDRLEELFHLVRETIVVPEVGVMNLFFLLDWRPVPDHDSFGHDVETAFLLIEAAEALHVSSEEMSKTWAIGRLLVDHALDFGWDEKYGGFYDAGTTFSQIFDPRKVWWIQAEGLNALAVMHQQFGKETNKYWEALLKEWDWIKRGQLDNENTGWIAEVEKDGTREKGQRKSDQWTEGYHQGRALMNVSKILGKLAEKE